MSFKKHTHKHTHFQAHTFLVCLLGSIVRKMNLAQRKAARHKDLILPDLSQVAKVNAWQHVEFWPLFQQCQKECSAGTSENEVCRVWKNMTTWKSRPCLSAAETWVECFAKTKFKSIITFLDWPQSVFWKQKIIKTKLNISIKTRRGRGVGVDAIC